MNEQRNATAVIDLVKIEEDDISCDLEDVFIASGLRDMWKNRAYIITRLSVPKTMRNKGIATKLLHRVCQDADAEENFLVLARLPYYGIDDDRLKKLYERFNFFEVCEDLEGLMMRKPATVQPKNVSSASTYQS